MHMKALPHRSRHPSLPKSTSLQHILGRGFGNAVQSSRGSELLEPRSKNCACYHRSCVCISNCGIDTGSNTTGRPLLWYGLHGVFGCSFISRLVWIFDLSWMHCVILVSSCVASTVFGSNSGPAVAFLPEHRGISSSPNSFDEFDSPLDHPTWYRLPQAMRPI